MEKKLFESAKKILDGKDEEQEEKKIESKPSEKMSITEDPNRPMCLGDAHPLKTVMKSKIMGARKMIEPLPVAENSNVSDFIKNVFGGSGYNARRLTEACRTFERMINNGATNCLTVAGAMTPIGMAGPIIELMKNGFIDVIISTGANLYHDLHRAYNCPVVQGEVHTDDEKLNKVGIARIYDVFIEDDDTMFATDGIITLAGLSKKLIDKPISTADLHYIIGKHVLVDAPHPEKSILAMAARYKVPVYCSSPADSAVGMNLMIPNFYNKRINLDVFRDIVETSAIVYGSEENGIVIMGGGSPKNFFLQTQPVLWEMLDIQKGGHDYFVLLTTDSPQWGGLSGATPQEAKSWGNVKDAEKNNVVVYSCASLTFPLLVKYVLDNCKSRELKQFMLKKNKLSLELLDVARKREKLIRDYGKKMPLDRSTEELYPENGILEEIDEPIKNIVAEENIKRE